MSKEHLVGEIAVRPVLEEGRAARPTRKRPEPGTAVTFDEELTAAKLTPEPVQDPIAARRPGSRGAAAARRRRHATAAAATRRAARAPATHRTGRTGTGDHSAPPPPAPAHHAAGTRLQRRHRRRPPATAGAGNGAAGQAPGRGSAAAPPRRRPRRPSRRRCRTRAVCTVARGVTRQGRPGAARALSLPLVPLAPPPGPSTSRFTERAVTVEWDPAPPPPPTTSTAATTCCSR
jgi:hypothetical protein